MCSLRDAGDQWKSRDVAVYGVSLDDVATLAAFAKDQELAFPLLSDTDGSLAGKYGVLMDRRPMAQRVTFVLDPKGVLRARVDRVDVRGHAAQITEILDGLADKAGGDAPDDVRPDRAGGTPRRGGGSPPSDSRQG